jgi:hypothetical protein
VVAEARNSNCDLIKFAHASDAGCPVSFCTAEKSYFLVFSVDFWGGDYIWTRKEAQTP